jgi:hypothetical protein
MGNQQTNLKIDHFFKRPQNFQHNKKPAIFKINNYDSFVCCDCDGNISSSKSESGDFDMHVIEFSSHMRDFEVVSRGPTIARGQGIGVIVDFSRNFYLKLWKDKNNIKGYDLFVTAWPTENIPDAKDVLSSDLSLGYDVLIIDYNNEKHQLCEKHDTRDTKETRILFSDFKKYAKYDDNDDASKSAKDDVSETEEKSGTSTESETQESVIENAKTKHNDNNSQSDEEFIHPTKKAKTKQ